MVSEPAQIEIAQGQAEESRYPAVLLAYVAETHRLPYRQVLYLWPIHLLVMCVVVCSG